MKTKFALHAILAVSIIALPLHAQHGHGGGGGAAGVPHGPGMGGMSTPHSSDHPSNHDSNRGSGKQQSSVSQRLTDNTNWPANSRASCLRAQTCNKPRRDSKT